MRKYIVVALSSIVIGIFLVEMNIFFKFGLSRNIIIGLSVFMIVLLINFFDKKV